MCKYENCGLTRHGLFFQSRRILEFSSLFSSMRCRSIAPRGVYKCNPSETSVLHALGLWNIIRWKPAYSMSYSPPGIETDTRVFSTFPFMCLGPLMLREVNLSSMYKCRDTVYISSEYGTPYEMKNNFQMYLGIFKVIKKTLRWDDDCDSMERSELVSCCARGNKKNFK